MVASLFPEDISVGVLILPGLVVVPFTVAVNVVLFSWVIALEVLVLL